MASASERQRPDSTPPLMVLRGTVLRYVLICLLQEASPSTIPQLVAGLEQWGFAVDGRPSKTISDALRWERRRGRVERWGRGFYVAGDIPRGSEHRIVRRVAALREEARARRLEALSREGGHVESLSRRGGQQYWWDRAEANDAAGNWDD